ncbi:hypothetical protein BH11ACT3_BH11ACT3_22050 [soil metagenome]
MPEIELAPDALTAYATSVRHAISHARDARTATDLDAYALALDEIAASLTFLDRHDLEIEHQLGWWTVRLDELAREAAAVTATDSVIDREMALFRGRISGAQAMLRHYQAERDALAALLTATSQRYGHLISAE